MRCRKIVKNENGQNIVVWFGSIGKNVGFNNAIWDVSKWDSKVGTSKMVSTDKSSYSDKQQAVVDSLIQRLSVIRQELWYAYSYGVPLVEKSSKVEIDSFILKTISQHPDVNSVVNFSSSIDRNTYSCKAKILSAYGEISITI